MNDAPAPAPQPAPHKRRPRYSGKNPRRFEEKYKEHDPARHTETIAKVLASGKTPVGTHRPIMVEEILAALAPKPGEIAVDATLGYGGHAQELLARIQPEGRLLGLDLDPIELPKTEARLRAAGFGPETFIARRSNFAGITQASWETGLERADIVLADLGVSSMQLDNPARGFSVKQDGPLDMRMNPERGRTASDFLARVGVAELREILTENADEPHADKLAAILAGKRFPTTKSLVKAVQDALSEKDDDAVRRVFQALRIAVNDEFSALETFLRTLPECLKPGGRAAILTFHSGEDRRVKKAFEGGLQAGIYAEISEVIRANPEERRANPRSIPAKLRWARKML